MSKSVKGSRVISKSKSASSNRYSRLTDPKKRAHVEAYIESKQTQQAYCAAQGLKLSSFKNWKMRYERENGGHFTPVITPPEVSICHDGVRIEISKKDCKVIISEIGDVANVIAIIKELL